MGRLRSHGVLLGVYGSALVLAVLELSHPEIGAGKLEQPDAYLVPELNIADVSAEIHPDRALTLYYQAYQASLCEGRGADAGTVCARRGPPRPGEVRGLIERSIATGNHSIELALYNYALVLLRENAPEAEVEAAVRRWRLAYPTSSHPDPRSAFRERIRSTGARP
jgi:hypothetical protein